MFEQCSFNEIFEIISKLPVRRLKLVLPKYKVNNRQLLAEENRLWIV